MEVDMEQHEDIPDYNTKYELDDGNQEYDSPTENGENKDIHYNSQSDSEEEIHKIVPSQSDRKSGMTRLPKLKTEYVNSSGKKTCQNVSQWTIKVRKMSKYDHRMGRGGYTTLRRKLIEENVISKDEIPPRSMEHEKQIKEGQVNVERGTDAMTLVFGKEKGGFLKGVGTGVTYNKYFNVPCSKGLSKEEI
ncbi:unnamed protein product [Lactuca saligna]|uniref:Uncharacterized protein n=1 Tax=Lactuca saligna TaxID=75948 RepID=A0AA35ZW66_LACSI|nr:unnamed protein product [Lactuca saligna]